MAIPRKQIFTMSEISVQLGRVVTRISLLADDKKFLAANLLPPFACYSSVERVAA
jgi:hypothetical protein